MSISLMPRLSWGRLRVPTAKAVENALRYGNFISILINFVIVMLVVYVIAKIVAKDLLK
jgi:large-conductance mechanosensitive channel